VTHRRPPLLALALFAGLSGCRNADPAAPAPDAPWFEDVTDKVGLDFVHDAGPTGSYFMPQIMGSGAALFDFDGDGRLDIYLLQNGGPKGAANRLYHQEADGRFRDVSAGSGLDFAGFNMGVAVGDVDNDGRPDVLVTRYTGVRLFLNEGGGKFRDATDEAGLDNPLWGTSAAFFDYDRDGRLDLVVVNYVEYDPSWRCAGAGGAPDYCNPNQFAGSVTKLFHNKGPARGGRPGGVRFEDVTLAAGLGAAPGPGLGVACADFDGDGWPDVFVANDGRPNRLWVNRHDGTFREEAVARGLAYNALGQAPANMGVALADVDGDGAPDVFVTHLTEETHTLWMQGPRGLFRDGTAAAGLAGPRWRGTGFGTTLADFDGDGFPDLAVVNGRVARGPAAPGSFWGRYAERNQIFANDGAGRFRDLSPGQPAFCGRPGVCRGLASGDVDNDGAPDLLVTEVGGRARLFRNVAPRRGHWLLVRALDPSVPRDALGAEIVVQAGGRRRVGLVNPGQSYLCSADPRVSFGLGDARRVEALDVRWPDGTRESFPGGPADRIVEVRRGQGTRTGPDSGGGGR
jgi:hypothetical protein